jgi:hypothetical protein
MKYLIVKGGPCGFGDRLQSLRMYVKFALTKNLKIYVDWEDPIWSHNGETFYTYFDLVNIPKLKSIDDIPADATVYPACWKGNLKLPYTEKMKLTNPEIDLGGMTTQDYNADVVVASSCGYRLFYNGTQGDFFGDTLRVIDQRIIQKVRERQQKYDLKTKIGIHLRGTDRAIRTDKSHRMDGINCRMVLAGLLNGTKFIAVSDDEDFISMWKKRYTKFPVLSESLNLGGRQGTHLKTSTDLTTSKDISNVDLLVDFFTLASCRGVISTMKDSRFANESQTLHNSINKILSLPSI